jgi:hypothetical protein
MENKSFIISVAYGTGCYRHIKISEDASLFDLHTAIVDSFAYEDDNSHAFFMDNKAWSDEDSYYMQGLEGMTDEVRFTDSYKLSEVGLEEGKRFLYIFDFGEEHRFNCRVLKMLEGKTEKPEVIKRAGEALLRFDTDFLPDEEELFDDSIYPEIYSGRRLKRMYEALKLPRETVELLQNYFDAFSNLYGIIPLSKALEIYNKQNEPISESDFSAFSEVVRHEEHNYYIIGEDDMYKNVMTPCMPMERELVHESVLIGQEDYEELKAAQGNKPYYIPSKRTLLKYADDSYIERDQEFTALRDYIAYKMNQPAKTADELAEELKLCASMCENDIQSIFDTAEHLGVFFESTEQANEFIQLYIKMANNTRIFENRGHTPQEMRSGTERMPHSIVLGPNIKKLIQSGDMNINEMRRNAERMNFPNPLIKASYMSELDRLESEITAEGKNKKKKTK